MKPTPKIPSPRIDCLESDRQIGATTPRFRFSTPKISTRRRGIGLLLAFPQIAEIGQQQALLAQSEQERLQALFDRSLVGVVLSNVDQPDGTERGIPAAGPRPGLAPALWPERERRSLQRMVDTRACGLAPPLGSATMLLMVESVEQVQAVGFRLPAGNVSPATVTERTGRAVPHPSGRDGRCPEPAGEGDDGLGSGRGGQSRNPDPAGLPLDPIRRRERTGSSAAAPGNPRTDQNDGSPAAQVPFRREFP